MDNLKKLAVEIETLYLPYLLRVDRDCEQEDCYKVESVKKGFVVVLFTGTNLDCEKYLENMKERKCQESKKDLCLV